MIQKAAYPSHFNNLWKEFDSSLGGKGSKPKAYAAYKALKCNAEDSIMLISVLQRQKVEKMKLRAVGEFYPNFKSVELWLRDRRFEDEKCERIEPEFTPKAVSRRDSCRAALDQPREREAIDGDFEQVGQLRIVE